MSIRNPKPGDVNIIDNQVWDGVKWIPMAEFWALCRIWSGEQWLTKDEWISHRLALGNNPVPLLTEVPPDMGSLQDKHDRLQQKPPPLTWGDIARVQHLRGHLDDGDVQCLCYGPEIPE